LAGRDSHPLEIASFHGILVCWTGALLTQGANPWPNVLVGCIVGLLVAVPVMIWLLVWSWPSREAVQSAKNLGQKQ